MNFSPSAQDEVLGPEHWHAYLKHKSAPQPNNFNRLVQKLAVRVKLLKVLCIHRAVDFAAHQFAYVARDTFTQSPLQF